MGTYTTSNSSNTGPREQAPVGTHAARVYIVAEVGYQKNKNYPKKEPKDTLLIFFELVNTAMKDGRPFVTKKKVSLKFFDDPSKGIKANINKYCEAILGAVPDVFNPDQLLGKPCMVVMGPYTDAEGQRATGLEAVIAVPEGFPVKAAVNEKVYFDIRNPKQSSLEKLYPWVQKMVGEALPDPDPADTDPADTAVHEDDDIPF